MVSAGSVDRRQAVAASYLPFAALSRAERRDLVRAAAFLWIIPLAAALSSFFTAKRNSVSPSATLPAVTAVVNFLTCVLTALLTERLRIRRSSLVRWRFFA
jgi:hypothetical protein